MKSDSAAVSLQKMNLRQCPVCRSKQRKRCFPISQSEVFECMDCGLRYLDPCLSPSAMSEAYESNESLKQLHDFHEGYYDYGDLTKQSKTRRDFERSLAWMESRLSGSPAKSILDIGYGNGFFLALAKERGWQVAGIDTSRRNAELARKKFSLNLACGDFERDIPNNEAFEAISFWDVIEHIPDPHPVLNKTFRVLKPGGFVVIGLPNDFSFLRMISTALYQLSFSKIKTGIEKVYFLEHVAYYSLSTLTRLAEQNGFKRAGHFYTRTDLNKYSLPLSERVMAKVILGLGWLTRRQNRLVAIFQKP
ncbi:MAG: methyltransferase domain-containing protein [Candidatus Omnitrophica bacterium]|nr:methyltransferase domain-containing protein [Candidatus Omnitrophota bacterium]